MKLLTTEDSMYSCVRCGACRDVCPTLDITGREADGPRGRVLMSRSLIEGTIPINDEIEKQLDRCLLCSACVDACPLDVAVPEIVMMAKEKIQESKKYPWWQRTAHSFFFDELLPHQKRLQWFGHLLWLYQKTGIQWLTRKLGVLKLFPESMRQMETVMPQILSPSERKPLPEFTASSQKDKPGTAGAKKVAMFRGCIMDMMFRTTNENTIDLLAKSGFDVLTPEAQVCCGALHMHNGKKDTTVELAKKNIEIFEQSGAEYVISNAGGCGAMLREYEELFRDESSWLDRAKRFSAKIRDVSEIVVKEGEIPDSLGTGERVTYQPSCHLQYVMSVKDAPKKLLKSIGNTNYVELPESKLCCGSAGIYNMMQPDMANDILDKKMGHAKSTQSDVIITANPGCLLQMKVGIERSGLQEKMKTMHIVDYLMEGIRRAENAPSQGKENKKAEVS